ncbi:MAG: hypothetical protein UIL37_00495 [Clostridia bacterium]|nr:hypothetical protein [Clostridia bacterium]
MQLGSVVKSIAGSDKGKYYIVIKTESDFAYIVDGKCKTIQKPKKKKHKHLQETKLQSDLTKYNPLYDAHIRKELKSLLKIGGCCLG